MQDFQWNRNEHYPNTGVDISLFLGKEDSNQNGRVKTMKEKKSNNVRWHGKWVEFTESTTLHGLRYIFMQHTFSLRRIFWLLLTLSCMGLMMYQIIDRIIYYYSSPSNVNVKINYNSSLIFPAFTICNQNAFRASAAKDRKWYRLIEDIYGTKEDFDPDRLSKYGAGDIPLSELFLQTGHRKEDLIVNCFWGERTCSWRNFTTVLTDHGLCYMFIAPEMVESTGADHGLKLLLNVEQYEYMPGPHDAAGIKVLTHGFNELPRVRELGISIPTGSHSFVGLQIIDIQNLPSPHGQCGEKKLHYFTGYSHDSCQIECRLEKLNEVCGCRNFFMPHINGFPQVCTLDQYYRCYNKYVEANVHEWLEQCLCPTACKYYVYDPVLSYATTSEFASEKLMDSVNVTSLQTKLAHAREVTNRMKTTTMEKFRSQIKRVISDTEDIETLVSGTLSTKLSIQKDLLQNKYNASSELWNKHHFYLQYQLYNIRKNFMRGRDAMEERTLSHLCNSFHEFVHYVETNLRNIVNENYTDPMLKTSFYINILDKIDGKQDTAERALANFTQLYNAYRTGAPIFRYKFENIPRRHNEYAVPRELMNGSTIHNQYARRYSPRLEDDITRMMASLDQYILLVNEVYNTRFLNITEMNIVSEEFLDSCEDYYHAKSVLYFETIDRPERVVQSVIDEFVTAKADLDNSRDYLYSNIEQLENAIYIIVNHCLKGLELELNHSTEYFRNESVEKQHLASMFISEDFRQDINNISLFFQEVRNRGQNIYDGWNTLTDKINIIWNQSLSYEGLKDYYNYIQFSSLLQNYEDVSDSERSEISAIRDNNDLRYTIGSIDTNFQASVDDVIHSLTLFMDSIKVNEKLLKDNLLQLDVFYRQLSYEEINQQRAYDVFALLCDIGGSMGLFVGASVMTVFELVDLFANFAAIKVLSKR